MRLTPTRNFFLIALIAVGFSCATSQSRKAPGADLPVVGSSGELETIVLMGTNDIHGSLFPEKLKSREAEGVRSTEYEAGGLATLSSYLKILRAEYGDRLIWLDGGDEFQGTLESNLVKGRAMVDFFNYAGLTAAAVGNHEFDYGPEEDNGTDLLGALKKRLTEAKYPYIAANILDRKSGKHAGWENLHTRRMFRAGPLKVGVIGLSTLDTPKTTRTKFVASLVFSDLKEATLQEAQALRKEGADLVVITSHVGLRCQPGRMPTSHLVRMATDPQGECGVQDEMVRLLSSLPSGTVDAVVSGHSHSVVHHWVSGVPVVQGGSMGRYFNLIYLTYDKRSGKILNDRTRIEGPIPVCEKVFSNQGDCNGDRPAPPADKGGRGQLTENMFHGKKIEPDGSLHALLEPAAQRAAVLKSEKVGEAARPIEGERFKESPLGSLVADAVRLSTGAQIALVNPGGIRAPIEPGVITYGNVFRSLPFDNALVTLNVTGQELMMILRIGLSGARGYTPTSGLKIKVIGHEHDAPGSDLNSDGKIDPWEINRILDVRTLDGKKIEPQKSYTLGTIDFLATGGDDVGWAMLKVPTERHTQSDIFVRDAVVTHIKRLMAAHGPVNSAAHPILVAGAPRIEFLAPPKAPGGRKRSKSKAKKKA